MRVSWLLLIASALPVWAAPNLTVILGQPTAIRYVVWPDQREVQAMFQQLVMQAMVGGHSHLSPVEIHADANGAQPISSVTVAFPDQFQKVLVVSYRPSQVWVDRSLPPADIRF